MKIGRLSLVAPLALSVWLLGETPVQAQVLLAQSGILKTGIGWLIFLLCLVLGLLVVLRPGSREWTLTDDEKMMQKPEKKKGR